MRWAVAVIVCLISVALSSNSLAQDGACSPVVSSNAGFLVECGNQLHSYVLTLSESKLSLPSVKRDVAQDFHGRFSFFCPVEPMCSNEPTVGGFFVAPALWLSSPKDEKAIFSVLRDMPWPGGNPPPAPSASCPVFDVSIGGMKGRAVCAVEGPNEGIVVVAADDRIGFLLYFSQFDKTAGVLKDRVLEMLPRFEIERATGEVGLKRWLR